ncbi:zinc finger and SCAN domain-containing protein 31-like [Scomber scombrus]|uniref:zinc finger and SCAN domain-containing protein 31-like n=1 Tax=Scomber scombrus TaxID=13677 RepID=UPI002DDBFAF9|nr:zinc finger and SCAN domain-containing protein 31-like [Scomber scombrus]
MCSLQTLKLFVQQRLTAAVEEIFGHLDKTITEYEEEIHRRHRRLLDEVSKPAVFPADVQQLFESREEVSPEQQEWSSSLDQEDAEPPHIKEEQEELWTSQEGEQLQGLKEADITKFIFTPVPVRSKGDEGKPQSSQIHQRQTQENRETEHLKAEADGEGCGGSELPINTCPERHLQPDRHVKNSHFSEPETEDRTYCWMDITDLQPDLNTLNNNLTPINVMRCNTGTKSYSCSDCGKRFGQKGTLRRHVKKIHKREKPFACSLCNANFSQQIALEQHVRIHSGEKPFSCSVCDKKFTQKRNLKCHMTVHTGEKPFSCSICAKRFTQKRILKGHMMVHTGEKPFSCSVCEKRFTRRSRVKNHKCVVECSISL